MGDVHAGAATGVFDEHLAQWRAWQDAPWGRIRYRVVAETLRRTVVALGGGPLRVLDVGGGDGRDALHLAAAGHDVTVVDYSAPLLDQAREAAAEAGHSARLSTVHAGLDDLSALGLEPADLVLCHNVIQYRDDTASTVSVLAPLLRAGGAVSLIAPNPASEVLAAVIRRQALGEARDLLDATTLHTQTFDHDVRRVAVDEVLDALRHNGFTDVVQYGIRCVTDYVTDDARKSEPAFYAELEQLELELCGREPFVRTARMWQVVARQG